jgi:Holliday junction resolvasome RuvABC ATP-dependent DNA helicase subunit
MSGNGTGRETEYILHYMYSHRYVIPIIEHAMDWEQRYGRPFKWYEIRVIGRDLDRLVLDGILTKVGNKGYRLNNIANTYAAYLLYRSEILKAQEISQNSRPQTPPMLPGIPKDLFTDIVGYDDVKRQFYLALGADEEVHILMIGPPSTAKSLFLEALQSLPGSKLAFGDAISKAGLRRFIMEEKPQYLIIDEIDKMDLSDASILLELMEHQTVSVMHYNSQETEEISLRVFAAANEIKQMKKELLSRFHKIYLREYTPEEFMRVAYQHLVHIGTRKDIAELIASGVAQKSRDIRDARRIAKMSHSVEDAEFLMSQLGRTAQV